MNSLSLSCHIFFTQLSFSFYSPFLRLYSTLEKFGFITLAFRRVAAAAARQVGGLLCLRSGEIYLNFLLDYNQGNAAEFSFLTMHYS